MWYVWETSIDIIICSVWFTLDRVELFQHVFWNCHILVSMFSTIMNQIFQNIDFLKLNAVEMPVMPLEADPRLWPWQQESVAWPGGVMRINILRYNHINCMKAALCSSNFYTLKNITNLEIFLGPTVQIGCPTASCCASKSANCRSISCQLKQLTLR